MVGVPGRSKGCSTCRKRKKKCDQQRPICGNCIKGKFACGGYHRNMIVVQVDTDGKGSYKPPAPEEQHQLSTYEASLADIRSRNLNRSTVEIDCFHAFWELYLPKSVSRGCPTKNIKNNVVQRWAEWIQGMTPKSDILRCALLALSVSKVGRSRQDQVMIQRGMELYGQSLSRFAGELKRASKYDDLELIATCRLFALYEQMNNTATSAQNWLRHIEGLVKLVEMQGPDSYSQPGSYETFLEVRYNAIVAAVATRKASPLSSPEWLTGPWKGRRKNPLDKMGDIFVTLPEVLEEFDLLIFLPWTAETFHSARLLKEKCCKIEKQLYQWYKNYTDLLAVLLEPEDLRYVRNSRDTAQVELLPDILIKYGIAPLYAMTLYWSACLTLYGMIPVLFKLFPPDEPSETDQLRPMRMDTKKYCLCIARSVGHFLHQDAGLVTAMRIAFPIGCVAQIMHQRIILYPDRPCDKDMEEVHAMLMDINNTVGGAWISDFLADMYKTSGSVQGLSHGFMKRTERCHRASNLITARI